MRSNQKMSLFLVIGLLSLITCAGCLTLDPFMPQKVQRSIRGWHRDIEIMREYYLGDRDESHSNSNRNP